jgi:hypothetical protein
MYYILNKTFQNEQMLQFLLTSVLTVSNLNLFTNIISFPALALVINNDTEKISMAQGNDDMQIYEAFHRKKTTKHSL